MTRRTGKMHARNATSPGNMAMRRCGLPRRRNARWLAVAMTALAIGCGDASHAPVRGTITWQGQPVPSGRINFYPDQGRPATSPIASDGTYALTTFEPGDGALIGNHVVTITASRTVGGPAAPKTFADELKLADAATVQSAARIEWIVPEPYSERSTSTLRAEVTTGDNTIDFNLTE